MAVVGFVISFCVCVCVVDLSPGDRQCHLWGENVPKTGGFFPPSSPFLVVCLFILMMMMMVGGFFYGLNTPMAAATPAPPLDSTRLDSTLRARPIGAIQSQRKIQPADLEQSRVSRTKHRQRCQIIQICHRGRHWVRPARPRPALPARRKPELINDDKITIMK